MSETAASHANRPHPLDAVVWHALAGAQRRLALGDERARRYPAAVAPFAAMSDTHPASFDALRALIGAHGPVSLVTPHAVPLPAGLSRVRHAVLLQMIWQSAPLPSTAWDPVALTTADVPAMANLTAATQPGPFGPRTIELGTYLGVRAQHTLVAMAGERMRLDGYTEISAVCVDDAHRGHGYAAGLMTRLIETIRTRGDTPFLHVLASNASAIALYRRLGFVERRAMHLSVLDLAAR